ncbi:MAG: pseudaminic acid synthase [bacterium]
MAVKIGKTLIGDNKKTFIVAELSANHNQKYDIALKTLKAIKASGADAVKLQTYTADTITLNSKNRYFKIKDGTVWNGKALYELYKQAYTPWEWHPKLRDTAIDLGLEWFSSPFDVSAVDFLEKLKIPAYKIASFEITDIPLIEYIASKGKPVIISSGVATKNDIENAIRACRKVRNKKIILLKCTSSYPAKFEEMNLRTISDIKKSFNVIPGLSDHTLGTIVPVVAVSLGAKVVEKHFILDKKLGGPDANFSLDPDEFKQMVDSIRIAEKSLGKVNYALTKSSKNMRKSVRSLFVVKNMKSGEVLTHDNIRSIRPGYGLHPKYLRKIIGKRIKKNVRKGIPFKWSMV